MLTTSNTEYNQLLGTVIFFKLHMHASNHDNEEGYQKNFFFFWIKKKLHGQQILSIN